jgi:hypothetical protein
MSQPSPGQQQRQSLSIRRIIALVLPCLAAFWLWNTRYPPIHEYKLYLTEDRKSAELPWTQLSDAWTEDRVQRHFQGHFIRCMPDEGSVPGANRLCIVDLKALNGVPTMTVSFFFGQGRLTRATASTPWWFHKRGQNALRATYGPPDAVQDDAVFGVRLLGWKLPNGGTVFYNRDVELNPPFTNSTQWLAPSQCAPSPCIR